MLLLQSSLLSLTLLLTSITAQPVDIMSCTSARITPILGPSYTTSPQIGAYCSDLLLSSLTTPPSYATVPAPPSTHSFSTEDVKRACECVLASFQAKAAQVAASTTPQQQSNAFGGDGAQERPMRGLGSGLTSEEQELRVRAGERWMPYGRGAVPVPLGSELKGFGARDNLYIRGGLVDGARARQE